MTAANADDVSFSAWTRTISMPGSLQSWYFQNQLGKDNCWEMGCSVQERT